jgi:hypothetical protein
MQDAVKARETRERLGDRHGSAPAVRPAMLGP